MIKKTKAYQSFRRMRAALRNRKHLQGQLKTHAPFGEDLALVSGDPKSLDHGQPLLFCLIGKRNPTLKAMVDHYRSLGCSHFAFIDHGSVGGTLEWLKSQDDAVVWKTTSPDAFARSGQGIQLINHLLYQLRRKRWVFLVEADEFLHLPAGCRKLQDLTRAAEEAGDIAIMTPILDMQADGDPPAHEFQTISELQAAYPLHDGPEQYELLKTRTQLHLLGGPMERLTDPHEDRPEMNKTVFFKWEHGAYLTSPHQWQSSHWQPDFTRGEQNLPKTIAILRRYKLLDAPQPPKDAHTLIWSDEDGAKDWIAAVRLIRDRNGVVYLHMKEAMRRATGRAFHPVSHAAAEADRKQAKVFAIGFNRCGTTCIHEFFTLQGIRGVHWDRGELARRYDENIEQNLPPFAGYEDYTVFTDMIVLGPDKLIEPYKDFRRLASYYENATFILNTRDREKWVLSRFRHRGWTPRYKAYLGTDSDEALFQHWRDEWDRHHEDVIEFFRDQPHRLLVYHIEEDQPEKLVRFYEPIFGKLDPAMLKKIN